MNGAVSYWIIEWPIYICIYIYIYIYIHIGIYQISVKLFLWKWPKVGWGQPNVSLKKPSWVASGVWTKNFPILILMIYPARSLPQILKLIGYLIRDNFMEKVCRKPAIKTRSMCLFNLINSPKQPMHVWDLWTKVIFKRNHEKGNLIFSFAASDFLRRKFWKAIMPGTSYRSVELQDMLTKREVEKRRNI